jgi:F0F1-type ATP synthase assembly protein I
MPRYATISIILGVIVGATAGFLNVYNAIMELERKEEQRKRDSSK